MISRKDFTILPLPLNLRLTASHFYLYIYNKNIIEFIISEKFVCWIEQIDVWPNKQKIQLSMSLFELLLRTFLSTEGEI